MPDVPYTQKELDIRKRLRDDFPYYALNCLKIKQKGIGGFVPLQFNSAQKYIHAKIEKQKRETGKVRVIILKGRQQGCSTYTEGRIYHNLSHNPGTNAFVLAHIDSSADILFRIIKKYHQYCPQQFRHSSGKNNSSVLEFDKIDSGFSIGTAGNGHIGRGDTIHYFHASEAAYYKNAEDIVAGAMGSVSKEIGSEVIIESTANGVGNWFHRKWLNAVNGAMDDDDDQEYIPIFVPWYWQSEYVRNVRPGFTRTPEEQELVELYQLSDEQLNWRRNEIRGFSETGIDGTKKFKQEYPNTPTEAFQDSGQDTFIKAEEVVKARNRGKKNLVEGYGPLIIGFDAARSEVGDRTALIRRQGRRAFGLETYRGKGPMECAGLLNRIIVEENPARVFIGNCNLGNAIADRLYEMGHSKELVRLVTEGGTKNLLFPHLYHNKRAEIWALGRKWLRDEEVSIPDSDEFQADLCCPKDKEDSLSRLVIESGVDIKKRNLPSPDTAVAFLLTFAEPVGLKTKDMQRKKDAEVAKRIMGPSMKAARIKKTATTYW